MKLQPPAGFVLNRTTARGGTKGGISWVWRLQGRHSPAIEKANASWSRPYATKAKARKAAMEATQVVKSVDAT